MKYIYIKGENDEIRLSFKDSEVSTITVVYTDENQADELFNIAKKYLDGGNIK